MANILAVSRNPLQIEVAQIIASLNDPVVIDNFTVIYRSLDEFKLMTIEDMSLYDAIVLGLCDSGIDISTKIADIMAAVDVGVGVLFCHDTFDSAWIKSNKADLVSHLALKGINPEGKSYDIGENNGINSIQIVDSLHPLITSYYDLKTLITPISTQWTHNNGAIVNGVNAKILLNCPIRLTVSDNSYLAVYEDSVAVPSKKIAFCAIGHNEGNWDSFKLPSIDECKIFVNILYWLCN